MGKRCREMWAAAEADQLRDEFLKHDWMTRHEKFSELAADEQFFLRLRLSDDELLEVLNNPDVLRENDNEVITVKVFRPVRPRSICILFGVSCNCSIR